MLSIVLMLQLASPIGVQASPAAALVRPVAACTAATCRPEARNRYRFQAIDPAEAAADAKSAALSQRWRECGTTGAPVCPRRGRQVWSMTLP